MSLLSKIFSEPGTQISRGDSIQAICEGLGITAIITNFPSVLFSSQSSLYFKSTTFIQQHPEVRKEITDFLSQQEVKDALSFDPFNYNQPITLDIGEENKKGEKPTNFGYTYYGLSWINAYYFSYKDPTPYLKSQRLKRLLGKELKKEDYQKYLDMLTELRKDPEMLKLYRGISLSHEIAHIRERYSLFEDSLITLTDHGFTNRIEIKVLTNLYKSSKVDLEMSEKIIHFFEKYLNNEQQPQHEIDKYLRKHFGLRQ